MEIRYEIEEGTHAVKVFYNGADVPSLYQPHFPDGTVWESAEEATEWAEAYVSSHSEDAIRLAPDSRGAEGRLKPTKEEIETLIAEREAKEIERQIAFYESNPEAKAKLIEKNPALALKLGLA